MPNTTDKDTLKFLNYELLSRLNDKCIKEGRNRSLYLAEMPIDPKNVYPVVQTLLHNDKEIRTGIMINEDDDIVWLDLTFKEFADLPAVPRSSLANEEDDDDNRD